jgi:hypothetical protein
MDDGSDGVCSTCSEERDLRRQHSAVQREYTVEEQVARCNYCRAQADEETPLDAQGYCPTCTSLARCCLHDDLIAVGHCKSCRQEYCRKCLGFTDVCQSCTAKNKSRPAKAAPPPAVKSGKKRAAGTSPMKEDAPAARKEGGTKRKKGDTAPLKGSTGKVAPDPADPDGKKKKKKAPTRGMIAMEQRMAAKAAPRNFRVVAASVAGAFVCLLLLSGMFMHASSPDEQSRRLQEQMIVVHRGIVHYYKMNSKLPKSPDQIYAALGQLNVRNARKIHIAPKPPRVTSVPQAPNSVLYEVQGSTFIVTAADSTGNILKDPRGDMVFLDQGFDSSHAQ